MIDAAGNVGRLRMNGGENAAVVVEGEAWVVVADFLDDAAGDVGRVDVSIGADLAGDDHLAGGAKGFDGDAGGGQVAGLNFGLLDEDGIEHSIADLVGHLIGMAHGDRFAGE